MKRKRSAIGAGLLGLLFLGQTNAPGTSPSALPEIVRDLPSFGFAVTTGAAPGYVDDRACALCHAALARSYAQKGMARSFQRPRPATDIEDFAAPPFFHAPSRQYLRIVRRGGGLVFERWQTDAAGQPIDRFEVAVDWILGSGDHARTYLYQTPAGELYQLPLAWYAQTRSWGMAPGYDRPDHEGVLRRVRRECIFCHTAYPDMPAGADAADAPQVFPAHLPEGLGCQRCHGPGAEHVGLALGGVGSPEEIRRSIFHPGRLPAGRRDEVCLSCHFQPSVVIPGMRRFGRGDFSFRAGEPLSDARVQMDIDEEGRPAADRFEINHHPYRLRQSRCYLESGGALSCLTCHDPHRRLPEDEREAHYRAACLTCHAARGRDGHWAPAGQAAGSGDCVSCHMPKRRTQDVVKVVMTDHRITRRPGGPELLAPLSETEPVLAGIRLLEPERFPKALGEVYRAAAAVRAGVRGDAVRHLEAMLAAAHPPELEPYLDLAKGLLTPGRFADAERTLRGILERSPGHLQAREWLALALAGQGRTDEAIAMLSDLVESNPGRPEAEYNLGRLLAARSRPAEAEAHLQRALAARPNLVAAWFHLGEVRNTQGRLADAIPCYRRALEIDPSHTRSYLSLADALLRQGDRAEALRYLRHGATAAAQPEQVAQALAHLRSAGR